jgi:hypothetical protein
MLKTSIKIFLSVVLICLSQILFAQTTSTDTLIYDNEEVIDNEDSVYAEEQYGDTVASTYKTAEFNFKDSVNQPSISKGNISLTDTVNSLKNKDDFWYADGVENKEKKEKSNNQSVDWLISFFKFLNSDTFKYFSWIVISAILLYFIYLFLKNNGISIFAPKPKNIATAEVDINSNIFEIDFKAELEKNIAAKNYSMAIRLHFLKTLRMFAELQLLEHSPDKTNFDYLMELQGKSTFKDFSVAVRYYEYVVYGNFEVNEQQFSVIQQHFNSLYQKISI